MQANDIAFGIEIETTLPGRDRTPIGGYHNGFSSPGCPRDGRQNATAASAHRPDANRPSSYRRSFADTKGFKTWNARSTRSRNAADGSTNLAGCTSR